MYRVTCGECENYSYQEKKCCALCPVWVRGDSPQIDPANTWAEECPLFIRGTRWVF